MWRENEAVDLPSRKSVIRTGAIMVDLFFDTDVEIIVPGNKATVPT